MDRLKNLPLTTHWKISLIADTIGVFVGLVCSQFSESMMGSIGMNIGFILLIFGFIWGILFLKCPHCGCRFHLKRPLSSYCPDCGKKIS